ncbi:MAG: hypothetical protein LBV19_05130, partial [Streptococcaceae bacterium]|nr:hypothetical protein [Streptococcaceae bacterium]
RAECGLSCFYHMNRLWLDNSIILKNHYLFYSDSDFFSRFHCQSFFRKLSLSHYLRQKSTEAFPDKFPRLFLQKELLKNEKLYI